MAHSTKDKRFDFAHAYEQLARDLRAEGDHDKAAEAEGKANALRFNIILKPLLEKQS